MSDRFVTEAQLEEAKRKRQEEWERVRKPGDPTEAPEETVENRSLYERLKEQRDKVQAEKEEAKKMQNMVRGLDDEESNFITEVYKAQYAEEDRKRKEEEAIFKEMNQRDLLQMVEASSSTAPVTQKRKSVDTKQVSKQKELLSGMIKRARKDSDKCEKVDPPLSTNMKNGFVVVGQRLSALVGYGDGSSSSDTSDSDSSDSLPDPQMKAIVTLPKSSSTQNSNLSQLSAKSSRHSTLGSGNTSQTN